MSVDALSRYPRHTACRTAGGVLDEFPPRGQRPRSQSRGDTLGASPIAMIALAAALLLLALTTGCAAPRSHKALSRYEFEAIEMAIPFRIVLYSADARLATNAANQAFARIHELNGLLSDYDPASELSRLSQTAGSGAQVPLSPDLASVLLRAQEISRDSAGAFDVTVGPVVQLWRRARRQKELPDSQRLAAARAAVGWTHLKLQHGARGRTNFAQLNQPGMRLDLGGIAKGYALDEASKILRANGLRRTLITGAGDMVAGDPPPGQDGWKIELAPLDFPGAPKARSVSLRHGSLCTSGDLFQHVEIDGVRYSHIVNPHTGLGLTDHGLVIVLGQDGMTTDALSTAISVLPPQQGLALADKYRTKTCLLRVSNGQLVIHQTSNFPK